MPKNTTPPIAYSTSMYLPYSHHARSAGRHPSMGQMNKGTTRVSPVKAKTSSNQRGIQPC